MNIPKMPNFSGLIKVGRSFVIANRPELLLGASVTATVGAVVLAAKGGYEAGQKVMLVEYGLEDDMIPIAQELTVKEKIQLTWLCYTPAAITTLGSLGSQFGLHYVHVKDKKALAQMAMASVEEVKEIAQQYRDDLVEGKTEKKAIEAENAHHEKHVDANGFVKTINSDGEVEELYLVRDMKTGRDIWSNKVRIEDAMNEVNKQLSTDVGDCELNFFYTRAGFAEIPEGDRVGWSGAFVGLEWDSTVRDDGRPVRTFRFQPNPEKGYDKR